MATEKYAHTSGNTSGEGEKIKQKITRKKELYLLFYTTGDERSGDNMMYHSAKTRRENIEKMKGFNKKYHLVFNVPIQDIAEIITTVHTSIEKHSGTGKVVVKEVSIFSHAGLDGPRGSVTSSVENFSYAQMLIADGWDTIDFHWAKNARFVMFGCNTAIDEVYNDDGERNRVFALDISKTSNFKDVTIWGQPTSSAPSFYPDSRFTNIVRSLDNGYVFRTPKANTGWSILFECYMVAIFEHTGRQAITYGGTQAKPMKKYRNGELIGRAFQSEFNDHRTTIE